MQVKVTSVIVPTPVPSVSKPVDPTPKPPVITPPPPATVNTGTKMLSSIQPVLAVDLKPASPNVLQCALFVPQLNQWFSTQATVGTNGARTPFENTVISRMTSTGALIDSMVLNNGGHGTSIGVEVVNGTIYIYGTFQANADSTQSANDVVRFVYTAGTFSRSFVPGLTIMPQLDPGYNTVSFDWDNDWVVVRNSGGVKDNYIRRKISDWKNGVNVKYGQINLQQGPPTLQGFCTMNDTLFRYIGATNGEQLYPADPTMIQQYSWTTGMRVDQKDYTALGKTSLGVYPDGIHEPESCTMYRESDGTATLTFSVTLGKSGNHTWKVYKLAKIGSDIQ